MAMAGTAGAAPNAPAALSPAALLTTGPPIQQQSPQQPPHQGPPASHSSPTTNGSSSPSERTRTGGLGFWRCQKKGEHEGGSETVR